ncbi:MAG: MmgE/PrpD family protein [Bacillota bacterium]|nr:MmgE/PrpD family protein [Bacillota bacterium]
MTTMELAERIVATPLESIPGPALVEAKRSLLNWVGVAIGAAQHPMVDMVLRVGRLHGAREDATVLGRGTKTDMFTAALANGISSHILDYDDTLLDTVLHPSAPVFPALLAYGETYGVSGGDFLAAFVMGAEVEQRIAQAIYPSHYDRGWHITGSVGAFGAAAAVGKLLGLDRTRMAYALGLAATQPLGMREMFGTFTKPYHPGKAAQNGLEAAFLAREGFTSSTRAIEAPRGFALVTSESPKFERLVDGWGETWEILNNSYKPFPCGIVIHPSIDGVMRLREKHGCRPESVLELELKVHPLVLELCGKKEPRDGLEAKFSVYHCAAIALIDGWVGPSQFDDAKVWAPETLALRAKVIARPDPAIAEDQVCVTAHLKDGSTVSQFVEHVVGSKHVPMTRDQLEKKFLSLTTSLSPERRQELIKTIWNFEVKSDVALMAALTAPDTPLSS